MTTINSKLTHQSVKCEDVRSRLGVHWPFCLNCNSQKVAAEVSAPGVLNEHRLAKLSLLNVTETHNVHCLLGQKVIFNTRTLSLCWVYLTAWAIHDQKECCFRIKALDTGQWLGPGYGFYYDTPAGTVQWWREIKNCTCSQGLYLSTLCGNCKLCDVICYFIVH